MALPEIGSTFLGGSCPRKINPRTVAVGMALNYAIALFVLKTDTGIDIFRGLSNLITKFLQFSDYGLSFLFGVDVFNIYLKWAGTASSKFCRVGVSGNHILLRLHKRLVLPVCDAIHSTTVRNRVVTA